MDHILVRNYYTSRKLGRRTGYRLFNPNIPKSGQTGNWKPIKLNLTLNPNQKYTG